MTRVSGYWVGHWEILASDISTQVLARARNGLYPMSRAQGVPPEFLRAYCLKGMGTQAGTLLIEAKLRSRVEFRPLNLIEPQSGLGQFDVIFLRNVMIYFDMDTKRKVVANLVQSLVPGGFFYIGHSETLNGVIDALDQTDPAIYHKSHS